MEDLVVQEEGEDMKTRELTGHKVDRYAQTDYICVPAELTYQTTHKVYTRSKTLYTQ